MSLSRPATGTCKPKSSPRPMKSFSLYRSFPWGSSRLPGMTGCKRDRPTGHASRSRTFVISQAGRNSAGPASGSSSARQMGRGNGLGERRAQTFHCQQRRCTLSGGWRARMGQEIDHIKACGGRYATFSKQALAAHTQQHLPLPADFPRWQARVSDYEARIKQCWKKYERRNRELAHLASNLLILLALLHDCRLICGENLTTLKTEGRGRGVRGRWRNWRNNTTVRGELWRVLRYKCHLFGIRARQVEPRGTTHTCPHCGKPAHTYLSPAKQDRKQPLEWAPWLCCTACGWNGARDYAASLNIARLGMAFLTTYHETLRYESYRTTDSSVKPALYIRAGATLLLPSQGITPPPSRGQTRLLCRLVLRNLVTHVSPQKDASLAFYF